MDGGAILKIIFAKFKAQVMKYDKKLVIKARVEQKLVEMMGAHPTDSIASYEEQLLKQGYERSVIKWCIKDIEDMSRKKREEVVKQSRETAKQIYAFVIEGDVNWNAYNEMRQNLYDKRLTYIEYKFILYYFVLLLDRRNQYEEQARAMTCVTAKRLIRELIEKVAMTAGIRRQNEMSYTDLKSALKLSQNKLEDYESTADTSQKNQQQKYITQFLSSLNEDDNGNLLNGLSECNERILQLESEGYIIPEELESIAVLVKSLNRFLKEYGVTEIAHKKHFITTQQDLDDCIYYGEPFISAQDQRVIDVKSPGWKYKDSIISKPVYVGKKVTR